MLTSIFHLRNYQAKTDKFDVQVTVHRDKLL